MARETAAGAVLYRRVGATVHYLLLHYAAGHWDFPKGGPEEGEEDEATVRREIREETGIKDVAFRPPFQETVRYSYIWKGLSVNKTVQLYLAETREEAVTLSGEHQGFAWLPYEEAAQRLTYDKSRAVLAKARAALS